MLTIKRVPTVVSNYQEDASQDTLTVGCGRNCLGKCCLPVSALPLYAFKKSKDESLEYGAAVYSLKEPPISFLNNLLLGKWEERMKQGLFRYDVTKCETKVISGKYGFIVQLNEGRHLKKRPTEFRVDQVLQPFDENKFNFMKAGQEEVLFRFEPSSDKESHFFPCFPVDVNSTPTVVAINVSPIEYGHVLLIPHVLDCLPRGWIMIAFCLLFTWLKKQQIPSSDWAIIVWVPLPLSIISTFRLTILMCLFQWRKPQLKQ